MKNINTTSRKTCAVLGRVGALGGSPATPGQCAPTQHRLRGGPRATLVARGRPPTSASSSRPTPERALGCRGRPGDHRAGRHWGLGTTAPGPAFVVITHGKVTDYRFRLHQDRLCGRAGYPRRPGARRAPSILRNEGSVPAALYAAPSFCRSVAAGNTCGRANTRRPRVLLTGHTGRVGADR